MKLTGNMLNLEDIELGRKNPDIYKVFCEKFIPCVMGKIRFRVNCYSKKLSEYCSVSDETMAVLVYANNLNQWIYKYNNPKPNPKNATPDEVLAYNRKLPAQKFFESKQGRGHTYSVDGYKFFNLMYEKIMEDRKAHGEQFDEDFICHMNETIQNEKGIKNKGKRKKINEQETMVRCYVDGGESGRGNLALSKRFENCAN